MSVQQIIPHLGVLVWQVFELSPIKENKDLFVLLLFILSNAPFPVEKAQAHIFCLTFQA